MSQSALPGAPQSQVFILMSSSAILDSTFALKSRLKNAVGVKMRNLILVSGQGAGVAKKEAQRLMVRATTPAR